MRVGAHLLKKRELFFLMDLPDCSQDSPGCCSKRVVTQTCKFAKISTCICCTQRNDRRYLSIDRQTANLLGLNVEDAFLAMHQKQTCSNWPQIKCTHSLTDFQLSMQMSNRLESEHLPVSHKSPRADWRFWRKWLGLLVSEPPAKEIIVLDYRSIIEIIIYRLVTSLRL